MKLQEFLQGWLNNVINGNVRASTFMVYHNYVCKHINPFLGDFELNKLRTENIQYLIQKLAGNEGRKLSPKTINDIFAMLKNALSCAVEYEYIQKNPCVKVRLPKAKANDIQIFTQQEQQKLENTIINCQDNRMTGVLICLYTGIRIGELCALRWDNIDLEKRLISIRQSLNRVNTYDDSEPKTRLIFEEPKTAKSKRLLPLPEFLCAILKTCKKKSNSEFVLSMKNGNPVQPRTMQYIYARLLKLARIEYRNFHALRHTFATRAIELGIDIKTVSESLGHNNSVITINRYTHSLMEQKQKMMKQLNLLFNKKTLAKKCSYKSLIFV